jgi:hypothetical protein
MCRAGAPRFRSGTPKRFPRGWGSCVPSGMRARVTGCGASEPTAPFSVAVFAPDHVLRRAVQAVQVVLEGFPADQGGIDAWDREVPARNGTGPVPPGLPPATRWKAEFSSEYPWYHLYPLRKHSLTTGGLSDCERRCASLPECWTCPSRRGQRHGSPTTWPRRRLAHERARRLSEASHPESVTRATLVGRA